jgi:sugar phosphate isomerase/epimerase
MGDIHLSYCTFGLTDLGILEAIDAVGEAGYAGVELSFHRRQLNPFEIDEPLLADIRRRLDSAGLEPACVATASHFFTPSRPHEPSLIAIERAGRKRRIDLIKRGIRVARQLGVRLVTFGSGFLRDEHVKQPAVNPRELLIDSIEECLGEIRDDEDITLLIEPEPGMFIETLAEGVSLIREIDSPRFRLHVDLCHAYCSETDYLASLAEAAPFTRYLHVSDARQGYNLRMAEDCEELRCELDVAALLVHFPDTADYLLIDREHPVYFREARADRARRRRIEELLDRAGVQSELREVDYPSLYAGSSPLDDEIFTYLISVPGLSFEVVERAKPVIAWLRGAGNPPLVGKMVANTLTGIAHFHEIPGEGTLDFAASFRTLAGNGFSGHASVELYHHVAAWRTALTDSFRRLLPFTGVH